MLYPARWKRITVDQSKVLKNWQGRRQCVWLGVASQKECVPSARRQSWKRSLSGGGGGVDSDTFFLSTPQKKLVQNLHNGVGVHHQHAWLTFDLWAGKPPPPKKNHRGEIALPAPPPPPMTLGLVQSNEIWVALSTVGPRLSSHQLSGNLYYLAAILQCIVSICHSFSLNNLLKTKSKTKNTQKFNHFLFWTKFYEEIDLKISNLHWGSGLDNRDIWITYGQITKVGLQLSTDINLYFSNFI